VRARLSRKQKQSIKQATCPICIWEGSIRSGKTVASCIRFMKAVEDAPHGAIAIVGKTRDSIARNVLTVIADLDPDAISFTRGASTCKIYGRVIEVIGANDATAEEKVRGLTLVLAYADEITVLPQAFFLQLLGRLSSDDAILLGTTNPDNPSHWLKEDFLDRKDNPDLGLRTWHFVIDDNPGLSERKKRQYKAQYTGLWYARFVLGLWVSAEGAIYDMLDEEVHNRPAPPPERWRACWIAADYGTSNPTHAGLVVLATDEHGRDGLYVVAEWEHNGRKRGQLTDAQISARMAEWAEPLLVSCGLSATTVLDPSAASLRTQMRRDGWPGLRSADNRVDFGLRSVASLFAGRRLFVDKAACPVLWKQLHSYVWDEDKLEKGVEEPKKVDDHGPDMLRYAVMAARSVWQHWLPELAEDGDRLAAA
jgi:PBSX family phage terminase large subunit